ncbi:MAG: DNA repair protein RecN [Prevotella sp.]|jgi:DNA repair protein RecN (Recombination protein N)|nr:DNA repair protein RecN [Prevotella sp.]MCH4182893.1 DNA repair protein RecN [Prevotella sp.]MCH4211714.1 DNA repair protein RecN [Prevotella sp.]MCH4241802.1 DNA repair protein RecN [Prevotella sp.]
MLKQLYIKNFTLIDELNIKFNPGFSVITGETGAGKSIILGAIGLLLGNRADSKAVKSGQSHCIIEAHFDLINTDLKEFFLRNDIDVDFKDTIIRRELTDSGKSRAFINDTPVQLALMRELGEDLVDIHSQHQNLLLKKDDFQLSIVDIIADNKKLLDGYHTAYTKYHLLQKHLDELKTSIANARQNEEFMRFQYQEIEKVNPQEGEQDELEQKTQTMSHAEEIKSALYAADQTLNADEQGIVEQLKEASDQLHNVEKFYPDAGKLASRLDSGYIDLKDIGQEISSEVENVDFDPAELQNLNERLDMLYSLEQKFHVNSVKELLAIANDLKKELSSIDHSDEELKDLQDQVNGKLAECQDKAAQLTKSRKGAAIKVESEMKKRLIPLGIPHVRFHVQFQEKQLSEKGCDKVSFLFSANQSTPMQPVAQVASGGEIARVMLSLKAMVSGAVKLPTIIFDEIDTGVSGKIAEKMALIMREMGKNRQVISITHLPQIAAFGSTHYKVVKEETPRGTVSQMLLLSSKQRVQEIAQMLSGSAITGAALANAQDLLQRAKEIN